MTNAKFDETYRKLIIYVSYKFYLKLYENSEIVENKNEYTSLIRKFLRLKFNKCSICEMKQPIFNFPTQTLGLCCGECKVVKMVDIKHKKCECKKHRPCFNLPGKTTATHCSECKKDGMIDIINIKCECGKRPSFNLPEEMKAMYCDDCKKDGMVDVSNSKCQCGKRPSFNLPNKTKPTHCNECKTEGMVNVVSSICLKCPNGALYNFHGQSPNYCCAHKIDNMILRPTRQCINKKCKDLAIYGINYPEYCQVHKDNNKTSLLIQVNDPCKNCNLKLLLNEDKLCSYCSGYYMKKHELDIKHFLDMNNSKYSDYNKKIDGIHSPDFSYEMKTHFTFLEVDELQHDRYTNDEKRMILIAKSQDKPVIFIRYNPDNYKTINKLRMIESDERK